MALPRHIRINTNVPFPALVIGSGPITIGKQNGVWQVGFSITPFASINPPVANWPTDFLLGYDTVAQQFFKVSISNLQASITGARNQRSVTATPIVISGTDSILNCNINVAAACALPAAATRLGAPLTFKDVGAQFGAHNLTITPNGAETIDNAATLVLNVNRQGVTLVPFNDGINTGWAIE
jgi:hypothetical protein